MHKEALSTQAIHQAIETLERDMSHLRGLLGESAESRSPAVTAYIESVPKVLGGEPVIAGTRTSVRAIVEYWKFGSTPEEIAEKLPYLRLAQIFAALSYYDDHREVIERYIAANRVPLDD